MGRDVSHSQRVQGSKVLGWKGSHSIAITLAFSSATHYFKFAFDLSEPGHLTNMVSPSL